MTRYRYTLTATRPVSAGRSDERANIRRAHEILPGSTVRGALAAQWWRAQPTGGPSADGAFAALFDSALLVGQAVPEGYELVSASARVCKYRSLPACNDVLQDSAVPGVTPRWTTCWHCGGPLASAAGWRRRPDAASVGLQNRTRGALTDREAAAEGRLFTRQALAAADGEVRFVGMLEVPDGQESWLAGLAVRVGGGRSVDFGAATVALEPAPWPAWPGDGRHLVRLVSPTILLDAYGGATVALDSLAAELRRVSGQSNLVVEGQQAWLRSEPISGWHMRSRLPKPLDWSVAAGSVVVVEGLTSAGWARLQGGLGYRTLEGYGQVERVDPGLLPTEPENAGLVKLRALRQKVTQKQAWSTLKRDLLSTLEKLQAADPANADLLRTRTFPGLLGEAQAAARSVLSIPIGHIPDTVASLKEMR